MQYIIIIEVTNTYRGKVNYSNLSKYSAHRVCMCYTTVLHINTHFRFYLSIYWYSNTIYRQYTFYSINLMTLGSNYFPDSDAKYIEPINGVHSVVCLFL